jgi:hypothetical protein
MNIFYASEPMFRGSVGIRNRSVGLLQSDPSARGLTECARLTEEQPRSLAGRYSIPARSGATGG